MPTSLSDELHPLRWRRRFATGLLLGMAGATIAALRLPPSHFTDLLEAASRAGLVGGLADWFAVTALFRRPLGLTIPHTAILPMQKARIGRGLGRFVSKHVFTPEDVARALAGMDVAGILGRFLDQPETRQRLASLGAASIPAALKRLEGERSGRVIRRLIGRLLDQQQLGTVVARVLRALLENRRHHQLLDLVLAKLREVLASQDDALRTMVRNRVREQGGRLVGWAMGASIATRVLAAADAELDRLGIGHSDLHDAIDAWFETELERLETDPARAAQLGRWVGLALRNSPALQDWIVAAWSRLRTATENDAAHESGHVARGIEAVLADLAHRLETDVALGHLLQRVATGMTGQALPVVQDHLETFIENAVAGWDATTFLNRLETRIGPDLQWVRINGTIVGFLSGGMIELCMQWLRHR